MPEAAALAELDLLVRGGACGVMLLPARLGALFALSGAAHALVLSPGICDRIGFWKVPILALATGGNVVFWLFSRALFDDAFRLRPHHAALWAAVVAVGLIQGMVLGPHGDPAAPYVAIVLTAETLAFVALALCQALSAWRDDLVEARRRVRLYLVAGTGAYIAVWAIVNLTGLRRTVPGPAALLDALGLALVASSVALSLTRIAGDGALFRPVAAAGPAPPPVAFETDDDRLRRALDRAMTEERIYRRDGLAIADLAQHLGLAEHRLRALINRDLGHRNFNAFVNLYRIADARQALADPAQSGVPILTIALDSGFASIGPFNRAFKAETGRTPSDFRRAALAEKSAQADSGIGQA